MTRKSSIVFTIAAVSRRGFSLSGLSKISRLQRESWGFRKCTANWMNGICGQTPRGKRMETETRSWGFEHTFQEFGSIRVNILGIWIDSGTPAPKMKSRSKIHAKFAVFSLFFCVFHSQNPQNFRLRRPHPQKSLNPQDFFQNASKSPALRNTPPPHPPSTTSPNLLQNWPCTPKTWIFSARLRRPFFTL